MSSSAWKKKVVNRLSTRMYTGPGLSATRSLTSFSPPQNVSCAVRGLVPTVRLSVCLRLCYFFFNDRATPEISTLSLHDALPIWVWAGRTGTAAPGCHSNRAWQRFHPMSSRSEEHTSELQSLRHLVCRLLLG